MSEQYGIDDLSADEVAEIQSAPAGSLSYIVGPMISNRSVIGWMTNGHVGDDLFFYYYGIKKPLGMIENTEIAHMSANFMNFDLAKIDQTAL